MALEPLYQGYVISDEQGFVQAFTLRSNRRACWDAFITIAAFAKYEQRKKELQRQGFKAVKVALLQVE